MFLDIAKINLKSGKGGDGAVAWRREKFEPSGGPAGGDGGDGGSIYLLADPNVQTLLDFKYKRHYRAENGEPGLNKKRFGKKGEDLILRVPVGTLVKEAESRKLICDLREEGQKFLVAKGGRGGRGNAKFANSVRQAPRFAEPGENLQEIDIILEVKLIADIGLVGLPNVGKSSILSIISDAKPKIANYHFTTLKPNLGVVKIDVNSSYIVADIPGLIEGASAGIGLGHDFLRHIERTRLLVYVLDMSGIEGRSPLDDYQTIVEELLNYDERLVNKNQVVVANKMDIDGATDNLEKFKSQYPNIKIIETSAATTKGLDELKYILLEELRKVDKVYDTFEDSESIDLQDYYKVDNTIDVYIAEDNVIVVEGYPVEELVRRTNFSDYESIMNFEKVLETMGVMDRVRTLGVSDGDLIDISGVEMEYHE